MEAALTALVQLVAWLTVATLVQELIGRVPQRSTRQKPRRKR